MSVYISKNYVVAVFEFVILFPAKSFLWSFHRFVSSFKFYFLAIYRNSPLLFLALSKCISCGVLTYVELYGNLLFLY